MKTNCRCMVTDTTRQMAARVGFLMHDELPHLLVWLCKARGREKFSRKQEEASSENRQTKDTLVVWFRRKRSFWSRVPQLSRTRLLREPEGTQGGSNSSDTQVRSPDAVSEMGTNPQGKRAERTRGIHPQALSHVVIQVTKIPMNGWPNFVRCQNRSQKSSKPHRDKVLRWHLSRPEFLFNSVVLPNWIKSIVWCACSYCIKKEKEAGKSYTKPTLFVCSAAIAKVRIVSASLRGVWRCRGKKSMHKKHFIPTQFQPLLPV